MREFRFRAWHEYGVAVTTGKNSFEPAMIYDDKPGDCLVWKNQGQRILDIMQFIGHRDQDDVEVFVGDLVEITHDLGKPSLFLISMDTDLWGLTIDWEFISGGHTCSTHILKDDYSNAKVIGNIHANPELWEAPNANKS